jgi:hypothetical protein
MNIDVEYAIKKDIRNNPIVREVDNAQKREFVKSVLIAAGIVALLLFAARQPYRVMATGYQIEKLRAEIAAEETLHRKLLLNLETLRTPQVLEERARRELKLVPPTPADILVLERATSATPGHAVVAQVR